MFADAVIRLHTDEAMWTRLSQKALEFARKNFSFDRSRDLFHRLLSDIEVDRPHSSTASKIDAEDLRFDQPISARHSQSQASLRHQMTEQVEEANDHRTPLAQAAKALESLSAALSVEIAMKHEVLAAREAEIARLHRRIVEMDARAQAAMGRETALQQQLTALIQFYVLARRRPLRLAKYLMSRFLTFHKRLPLGSGDLVSSQKTELLATDQLNLNAEPDNVRHLYLRLVRTRERISAEQVILGER